MVDVVICLSVCLLTDQLLCPVSLSNRQAGAEHGQLLWEIEDATN